MWCQTRAWMFLDWPQYHSNKLINTKKKTLNTLYIFLFCSSQPKSFAHKSETEQIRSNSKKWIQPNPYSLGWVGLGCQVEYTLVMWSKLTILNPIFPPRILVLKRSKNNI